LETVRCRSLEYTEDAQDKKTLMQLIREIREGIRNQSWRTADLKIHEYLRQEPNDPDALMYLGISRAAQGFEPEGEQLLLASLTFNPRNKDAYYNLGLIVMNQGRCIFASEAFRKGLSIVPDNHARLYPLGRALERLGNVEESLDAYQQALNHDPDPENPGDDFTSETRLAIEYLQDPKRQTDAETCEE